VVQIYLSQRTNHATSKSHDESGGEDELGIVLAPCVSPNTTLETSIASVAPGLLEFILGAQDAQNTAQPTVHSGSLVSYAPSMLESIFGALDAIEAVQPTIPQCATPPTTTTPPLNAMRTDRDPFLDPYDEYFDKDLDAVSITILHTDDHLPPSTDMGDQAVDCAVGNDDIDSKIFDNMSNDIDSDSDAGSDIENALPCLEVKHASNMRTKTRNKVAWAVPECEFSEMPEDKDDEYRYVSISREQRHWIPRKLWTRSPQTRERKHEKDDTRLKWKTRHESSRHVEVKSVYNLAQARRSALVMSFGDRCRHRGAT
jgi:hypothetical protein